MQSNNQLIRKIKRKQNKEAADVLIGRYYKEIYAFALDKKELTKEEQKIDTEINRLTFLDETSSKLEFAF